MTRFPMLHFVLFLLSLAVLVKSASMSIRYSSHVAKSFGISSQLLGFLVIAFISVLPEGAISITSALKGVPSFGLGTLFGSNVADLTFVMAVIVFFAREIKIQQSILQLQYVFLFALMVPLFLGVDGAYTRLDGGIMVALGILFYFYLLRKERKVISQVGYEFSVKNLFLLLVCMGLVLVSAHFTVEYGVLIAEQLHIHPILVGLLLVGLGTTLPELLFSLHAVRKRQDGMAMGDILGTVITDAVIIVGLMSMITPFSFEQKTIFVTGAFMLFAALLLFFFLQTDRILTRREASLLMVFYLTYVVVEFFVNQNGPV